MVPEAVLEVVLVLEEAEEVLLMKMMKQLMKQPQRRRRLILVLILPSCPFLFRPERTARQEPPKKAEPRKESPADQHWDQNRSSQKVDMPISFVHRRVQLVMRKFSHVLGPVNLPVADGPRDKNANRSTSRAQVGGPVFCAAKGAKST